MRRLKWKDGNNVEFLVSSYWKKDGDTFALPRVVEASEEFYWLRPGEQFTMKGKPPEEEGEMGAVEEQLIAFLKERSLVKTRRIDDCHPQFPKAAHLAEESEIVWLRDPKEFPYLRQSFTELSRRDTPFSKCPKDGELIGYATLATTAKAFNGRYYRRFFWFKTDGRDPFKSGAPGEAVTVSSIQAGFPASWWGE